MPEISKGHGLTASEKYLGRLANRSFLNLWSFQNVYIDKFGDKKRVAGKELCDLLVVCGDHVLVFSDKTIGWPSHADLSVSWSRWHRQAVQKSVDQVLGAKRWIEKFPDRIFLDKACTIPFPWKLPSRERMRFHGIVVALGAAAACRSFFNEGSGSLIVAVPPLGVSVNSLNPIPPFTFFSSRNPDNFVHLFDDVSLDIVLRELDTITDLTDYLDAKKRFICGNHLAFTHGEEELLACYLTKLNSKGEHDFVDEDGKDLLANQILIFEGGHYERLRRHAQYRRKKQADRLSYLWDRLIERFTRGILEDDNYSPSPKMWPGPNQADRERAVREMALLPRLIRRSNSEALASAVRSIGNHDRFFRAIIPGPTEKDRGTVFFILLMKRGGSLKDRSDVEYREFRATHLYAYALNLLRRNPDFKRVVGIATEGDRVSNLTSEDLLVADQQEWTDDLIKEAEDLRNGLEIFQSENPPMRQVAPMEYPEESPHLSGPIEEIPYSYLVRPPQLHKTGNRQERRKAAAKARRRRR
jgi:hypothetical protein